MITKILSMLVWQCLLRLGTTHLIPEPCGEITCESRGLSRTNHGNRNAYYRQEGWAVICSRTKVCIPIIGCAPPGPCGNCRNLHACYREVRCPHWQVPDGTRCTTIDICATSRRHCAGGSCENIDGSYRCTCRDGYNLSHDSKKCIEVCEDANCGPNFVCKNIEGRSCKCRDGYKLSRDGKKCIEVCKDANCGPNFVCKNTKGSAKCICEKGFVEKGDTCTPIDTEPPVTYANSTTKTPYQSVTTPIPEGTDEGGEGDKSLHIGWILLLVFLLLLIACCIGRFLYFKRRRPTEDTMQAERGFDQWDEESPRLDEPRAVGTPDEDPHLYTTLNTSFNVRDTAALTPIQKSTTRKKPKATPNNLKSQSLGRNNRRRKSLPGDSTASASTQKKMQQKKPKQSQWLEKKSNRRRKRCCRNDEKEKSYPRSSLGERAVANSAKGISTSRLKIRK